MYTVGYLGMSRLPIYFQRAGKTNGLIIDIPQVVMGEAIKKTQGNEH